MATGFYVMSRLTVGTLNIWFVFLFPHFRLFHAWNAVTCIAPVALWIGALWVEYELAVVLQWMSFLFGIFILAPRTNGEIGSRIISCFLGFLCTVGLPEIKNTIQRR